MTDKYYTPELEEFHVGFEYEQYDPDSEVDDCPYKKQICHKEDLISTMTNWKYYSDYRVKYLDKQDIEECGFELYKIHAGTTTHEFESKDSRYMITFDPNFGKGWNITIADEVDFIFFYGFLNNKNELKKLLKQLGI